MRFLLVSIVMLPLFAQAEIKNAAQVSKPQMAVVAAVDANKAETESETQPAISQPLQANIEIHSTEELKALLEKAEKIANGETQYNTDEPIAVVLHGAEINAFVRKNYRDNKALVDLAARLDAFNVIDVKVCRRWMGANGISEGDLPPFLEAVPWGAGERVRLQKAGYAFF